MHGMRASRHHRVALLARAPDDHQDECVEFGEDQVCGGTELEGEGGVNHIATGEAVVEVAPFGAHRLSNGIDEGERVVIKGCLKFSNSCEVHRGARLDRLRRLGGDVAALRLSLGYGHLNAERCVPARIVPPDVAHLGCGVSINHGRFAERRIGRHARSIVCVRSGPTESSTIGAPASSSSAVT